MSGKRDTSNATSISRREFARRAAIVSAVSMVPASALTARSPSAEPRLTQAPGTPSLSHEGQAESEARYQAILAVYGSRFSDSQKTDLRKLCFSAQEPLDHLRAYPIENGDAPALYLKPLVEREKQPGAAIAPHPVGQSAAKP
jgi:hypothetical protein